MKKETKKIFIGLSCFIVAFFYLIIAASHYFYKLAIKRSYKKFMHNNKDLPRKYHKKVKSPEETTTLIDAVEPTPVEQSGEEWVNEKGYETWNITSEDGLKLVGYYIPATIQSNKTVILAHGYSSKGKNMGNCAKLYSEKLGYNVLMPDARGHGESEGDYIGFGWPERKDYLIWIQRIINEVGTNAQIVLHGISMGAATVMMVSGEDLPEQVKVIVEDCGYTSAYEQLSYQLKRMYNLPKFPLMPATSLLTDIKDGYNFYEASALKQVQKNKLPMLFIHGEEDLFVPTEMVWKLYEVCVTEKDIYLVKGAGHGMAYSTDKPTYEKKVAEFISKFIK
ncbi:MAG: hypothetical protein K0R15_1392 [Clostridiales bacterium]|jgi:fermentation-respiration switch protein FrsA (DUF1100 family)|nr:hypothetical protein [Clostridiales bacterium]